MYEFLQANPLYTVLIIFVIGMAGIFGFLLTMRNQLVALEQGAKK